MSVTAIYITQSAFLQQRPIKMLLKGQWVESASGKTFETFDPSSGKVLATVVEGGHEDINRAVIAARKAFESGAWPRMTPSLRGRLLWKLADLIEQNADELALLEALDNGKPIKYARHIDVPQTADHFRYFAGWATKLEGDTIPVSIPMERVTGYIEIGRREGAIPTTGGERSEQLPGYFMQPTVFDKVSDDMTIAQEEIFGPVVVALPFEDIEEVAMRANKSMYGLAAGVWTSDIKKAHKMAAALKAGVVWINTYNMFDAASPFGGYKQSGYGREMGHAALDAYTQTKAVWLNVLALTYRNKVARANDVIATVTQHGSQGIALPCDLTHSEDVERLFQQLRRWTDHLDALVLNASGGLEREFLAADPYYPMRIMIDAQLLCIDAALTLLPSGRTIIFVTSHWAHLYGRIKQISAYESIAKSKHAGEQALRARQDELTACGIRLVVVTGDLIEGTVTPKLLERIAPDIIEQRRAKAGSLPTAADMGREIALTVINTGITSGSTVAVGEPLQSLLARSSVRA